MTKLATAVAKTLLKLAYNETKEDIVASEDRVSIAGNGFEFLLKTLYKMCGAFDYLRYS